MVPLPRFIDPKRVAQDDNVDAKYSGKLSRVIRKGYVIVGEVNSMTH